MPNWCANRLRVTGRHADVADFAHRASAGEGLDAIEAAEVADLVAAGDPDAAAEIAEVLVDEDRVLSFTHHAPLGGDWDYDRAVAAWGTKWDARDARRLDFERRDGTGSVVYTFDTAWGPPSAWLATASAAHPGCTFTLWWNEEQGFCGRLDAAGGDLQAGDLDFGELREDWPDAPYPSDWGAAGDDDEDEDGSGPGEPAPPGVL